MGRTSSLVLCTLIILSLFINFGMVAGEVEIEHYEELPIDIMLKSAQFDPLLENPSISSELIYNTENNFYLVQLNGPIMQEWIFSILDSGAQIMGYIPDFTYIVHMESHVKSTIEKQSFVRWIGIYHPAYKIEKALFTKTGSVQLNVMVFEEGMGHEHLSMVKEAIESMGGTILLEEQEVRNLRIEIESSKIKDIAFIPQVEWLDEYSDPVSFMDNIRVFTGAESPLHEYGFNGTNIVGEVKDNGIDQDHPEFVNTLIDTDGSINEESHGSSTFGIVFAEGETPRAMGMMPNGQGVFCDWGVGRKPSIEHLVNTWGGLFQSNSWSQGTNDGTYTSSTRQNDEAVFEYDINMLYATGNGGNEEEISRDAVAKNIIAVGALNHYNNLDRTDDQHTGGQGNRGPTSDGRIKPDLVGPYDSIYTTSSGGGYTSGFGGTSGATPIVAGGAGLVYEMYISNHFDNNPQGEIPHASTVKALLIADAYQYEFSQGNRMAQGWGLVDVGNTYQIGANHLIDDESKSLTTGESEVYTVQSTGIHKLKISLVWTDVPGTTSASKHLVNDLDLKVTDPDGLEYWGNFDLDSGKWSSSGGTADTLNNVENVFIESPKSGDWTIVVTASNIAQDGDLSTTDLDQKFSLVASGVMHSNHDNMVFFMEDLPRYLTLFDEAQSYGTISNIGFSDQKDVVVNLLEDGVVVDTTIISFIESGTSQQVSFNWIPAQEKTSIITIEVVKVLGEDRLNNNQLNKSVDLFTPNGLILVDSGHGNAETYNNYYEYLYSLKYPCKFISTEITSVKLAQYNVFITVRATSTYTSSELSAIQNFVSSGGGLLVIGDDEATIYDGLTDYAGIAWNTPRGVGQNLTNINQHNITENVFELQFESPNLVLEVVSPAEEVVLDNGILNERPLVAAAEFENGRLVAVTDDNSLDDSSLDSVDNRQFGENVIFWLNKNLPPIAIIDSPIDQTTYSAASSINFDASSSYDPDGNIVDYVWNSDIDGNIGFTQSFNNQLSQGDHLITLAVTDDKGRMAETSISLIISVPVPPTIKINSPNNNEKVNAIVMISGTSSDSDGTVDLVEVNVGSGSWLSAQGTSNWNFEWDTTSHMDGTYEITARAVDDENQYSDIKSISLFVDNTPPDIVSGPKVENITHQKATIIWETDEDGDCIVEYGTDSSYGLTETKNLLVTDHEIKLRNLEPDTTYHFRVITEDALGNVQITSQDRTFRTEPAPDLTPPFVEISSHSANDILKGSVQITVDAQDESGVEQVDFYVDDEFKFSDSKSSFSWQWNTATGEYPDGQYTLKVVAIDKKGNKASYEITVELDNEKVPPSIDKTKASPSSVKTSESTTVLFTVKLDDPEGAVESVEIDLSRVGGSSSQRMYDDGTHGDETASDNTYSTEYKVSSQTNPGEKSLTITITYFGGGTLEDDVAVYVIESQDSDPLGESDDKEIMSNLWLILLLFVMILVLVLVGIGRIRSRNAKTEFVVVPQAQQVYQAQPVYYQDQSGQFR